MDRAHDLQQHVQELELQLQMERTVIGLQKYHSVAEQGCAGWTRGDDAEHCQANAEQSDMSMSDGMEGKDQGVQSPGASRGNHEASWQADVES